MSDNLGECLKTYAELVVKVALNIQPGQRLMICDPYDWGLSLHTAPLVEAIAGSAYHAGASFVDVLWGHEELRLMAFRCAPPDTFERLPAWWIDGVLEYFDRGDAVLILLARNPDLLKDQDPSVVTLAASTGSRQLKPIQENRSRLASNCAVVAAPIPGWATKVFPGIPAQEAEEKLWQAIFAACYVHHPDPVLAWREHAHELRQRADYLNHKRYTALRFLCEGTHLSVGLPEGHIWCCAGETSQQGIPFVANMPTEEVFTLPLRDRVDGVVRSTRPLSYGGVIIEDFTLTFESGRVVGAEATKNEDVLARMLETDEGASRLGEVALLPNSSPISQSRLVYFNVLYDENAASHLALGHAWKMCLRGGESMDDDAFTSHGGNQSAEHEDFMIGSSSMDVDGIGADDATEPIMRKGEWVFTP